MSHDAKSFRSGSGRLGEIKQTKQKRVDSPNRPEAPLGMQIKILRGWQDDTMMMTLDEIK